MAMSPFLGIGNERRGCRREVIQPPLPHPECRITITVPVSCCCRLFPTTRATGRVTQVLLSHSAHFRTISSLISVKRISERKIKLSDWRPKTELWQPLCQCSFLKVISLNWPHHVVLGFRMALSKQLRQWLRYSQQNPGTALPQHKTDRSMACLCQCASPVPMLIKSSQLELSHDLMPCLTHQKQFVCAS